VISEDAISEILSQYKKFGWRLERVLLSDELTRSLGEMTESLFGGLSPGESDLDAAWFSRPNANGRLAWELRSLTTAPFALVDSTEPEPDPTELDNLFQRVEEQLRQRLIRPQGN
jgi:hypothetical protein